MQINNKLEDLTKVFDRTWKANHNDDVKKSKEKEKDFIDKMFNVKKVLESNNVDNSSSSQINNLQKNMNSMNSFNNHNKLNDIKGKF